MFDIWIEKMCVHFYFYRFDKKNLSFKIKNQCIWKICFSILDYFSIY
jgi:hypothetical protein